MTSETNVDLDLDTDLKDVDYGITTEDEGETRPPTPKLTNDHNDWICGICHEFEAPDDSNLILCDGPCGASYHFYCIGFVPSAGADKAWLCDSCKNRRHACFICGDESPDDEEGTGVFKCSKRFCGKYYHLNCLEMNYSSNVTRDKNNKITFICPYHTCDTCGVAEKSGRLIQCQYCPKAYHKRCKPPDALQHDFICLCPEHRQYGLEIDGKSLINNTTLLSQATNVSFNLSIFSLIWNEDNLPKESRLKYEKRHWLGNSCHYRLPNDIYESVNSRPAPYQRLKDLKYLVTIEKVKHSQRRRKGKIDRIINQTLSEEQICKCTNNHCGENCVNRLTRIECTDNNCRFKGIDCGNRQIQMRDTPNTQVFREGGMGWGLKALEYIPAGKLVMEYVGEVIDYDMVLKRLREHKEERPHDHSMYIMQLAGKYFIDARFKGSVSRFINHSCDPNCELQRWNVDGHSRIGIVAIKDVYPNEALSYDYQFATQEEDAFTCYCGTKKCRGTMAPKKKTENKSEIDMLLEIYEKRGSKKIKKKLVNKLLKEKEADMKENIKKRNYVTKYLPGDKSREIKRGPPRFILKAGLKSKLFLPRNVRIGNHFYKRKLLRENKINDLRLNDNST